MIIPPEIDSPPARSVAPPEVHAAAKWRLPAACLCAGSIVLLTLGSLYSPIVKLHLRPILAWQFLPLTIRAHQHRLLHILGFALPALLFFTIFRTIARALSAVSLLALMAVTLEFIQHRVYSSPLEWWDICDDLSGILLSVLLVVVLQRFRPRPKNT